MGNAEYDYVNHEDQPDGWQNLSATSVRLLSQQHENANQFVNFSHMTYTGCGDYYAPHLPSTKNIKKN